LTFVVCGTGLLYLWAATILFPSCFLYFSRGRWCFGQIAMAGALLLLSLWGLREVMIAPTRPPLGEHGLVDGDDEAAAPFPGHRERWEWRASRRMASREWIQSHRNRYTQLCHAERLGDSSAHSSSAAVLSDDEASLSSLTSSAVPPPDSCRCLCRQDLLLKALLLLLITKSVLLLLVSSPVALWHPVLAFFLQPLASRAVDLAILQLLFCLLRAAFSASAAPLPDLLSSLSWHPSSAAEDPHEGDEEPQGLGLSWRDLSADFEDIVSSRRYLDLDVESSSASSSVSSLSHISRTGPRRRWDIVVTDPGQEFSLQDLRCPQPGPATPEPYQRVTRDQRERGTHAAPASLPRPVGRVERRWLPQRQRREPKEILDDLLTI
jgi:hypothetical protein